MATIAESNPHGWIRGPGFDLTLIAGVAVLALAFGAAVVLQPDWFLVLLVLDLWLLGYPHVIATFSRISFDTSDLRENRFLVLGLPWIVFAATIALGSVAGLWALATTYLYWQWFHYTRQSYGLMRYYVRRAGAAGAGEETVTTWALYLVPLWGILHRSHQGQEKFLNMEVKYLPTPAIVVDVAAALALLAFAAWAWFQIKAWREGRLATGLTAYTFSHFLIFFVGYVAIEDITFGWLVINVWHNAQYLLIVWMYNVNRFKGGVDPQHALLSTLSQAKPAHIARYFLFILGVSTIVYLAVSLILRLGPFAAIPLATLIVYQTINFHHYIVDGLIWKKKRRTVRLTPGAA